MGIFTNFASSIFGAPAGAGDVNIAPFGTGQPGVGDASQLDPIGSQFDLGTDQLALPPFNPASGDASSFGGTMSAPTQGLLSSGGFQGFLDKLQDPRNQFLLNFGANMLAQSGPSVKPIGLGEAIGKSYLATNAQIQNQQLNESKINAANAKSGMFDQVVTGADANELLGTSLPEQDAVTLRQGRRGPTIERVDEGEVPTETLTGAQVKKRVPGAQVTDDNALYKVQIPHPGDTPVIQSQVTGTGTPDAPAPEFADINGVSMPVSRDPQNNNAPYVAKFDAQGQPMQGPEGRQYIDPRLVHKPVQTNVNLNTDMGLGKAAQDKAKTSIMQGEENAVQVFRYGAEAVGLLKKGGFGGLAGSAARIGEEIKDTARGLSVLIGTRAQELNPSLKGPQSQEEVDNLMIEVSDYIDKKFPNATAEQSQILHSVVTSLAYMKALANDPSGRVSDKDFKAAVDSLGAGYSDPETFAKVITGEMRHTKDRINDRMDFLGSADTDLIPWVDRQREVFNGKFENIVDPNALNRGDAIIPGTGAQPTTKLPRDIAILEQKRRDGKTLKPEEWRALMRARFPGMPE